MVKLFCHIKFAKVLLKRITKFCLLLIVWAAEQSRDKFESLNPSYLQSNSDGYFEDYGEKKHAYTKHTRTKIIKIDITTDQNISIMLAKSLKNTK